MDDRRFDNVVRALARHRSRRGLVGGLLGGGVALLASHLRLPSAVARRTHAQGEFCLDDDQCDPCRRGWSGSHPVLNAFRSSHVQESGVTRIGQAARAFQHSYDTLSWPRPVRGVDT